MWPRFSRVAAIIASACIIVAFLAFDAAEHVPAILIGGIFATIVVRTLQECASTMRETAEVLHAHADAPTFQANLFDEAANSPDAAIDYSAQNGTTGSSPAGTNRRTIAG